MKKLFALLLFCPFFSNAQISLAHTFNFSNNQTNLLYIDLGDGDFKYVAVDYVNSKINIYNTDFTPYLTNITTALPMTSHEIAYISKKLFDCDSTTIEYVLVDNDFTEFRVFNTSGAPVFSRVNVIAPFCYGCYNASLERKPIVNTAEGTKLILSDVNGFNTYVYNLCGTLPLQVTDFEETGNMLTVYPVPASANSDLNFKVDLPETSRNNSIEIYDMGMKLIDKFNIDQLGKSFTKQYDIATGNYFYVLRSGSRVMKTGKFIISR